MAEQPNQPPKKTNSRAIAILVIVIVVLIGLGVYVHYKNKPNEISTPTSASSGTPSKDFNGTLLPKPKSIGQFNLYDDNGNIFSNANLQGHWTLMFFGFTHCSDVCPTTLTELNKMYQDLQTMLPEASLPQVIMVTVDPERDTTEVMHNYVRNFNPYFIGLRPDEEDNILERFKKEMGVTYGKVTKEDGSYGMQHSAELFIFNPDGNWVGILNYPHKSEQLAKDYQSIINSKLATQ